MEARDEAKGALSGYSGCEALVGKQGGGGVVSNLGREKGLEMRDNAGDQRAVTMHVRLVPLQIKGSTV